MSVAESASNDPHPIHQWVMHHLHWVLGVTVVLLVLGVLAPNGSVFGWATIALIAGNLVLQYQANNRHARGFCQRCANRPLGSARAARNYQSSLQWTHWYHQAVNFRRVIFLGGFGAMLLLTFLSAPDLMAFLPLIVILLLDVINARCVLTHSWMLPWCPWCNDDGGGGEPEQAPEPDPVGHKQA